MTKFVLDWYIAGVQLLLRDIVEFNKSPDAAWIVQHSELLLDGAKDAGESYRPT